MSCVAFVPLKMMLLSLVLSNWRERFFLLPCVALNSLPLLFPHMLQPNLCRGKLHSTAGYFKWLFFVLCPSEKKERKKRKKKSSWLACMGGELGWDFSGAGET